MIDYAILPECYVDTNLVETISPPQSKGYNHQKGCGTVAKVMREKFGDSFALGIIDKDKKELDYLKEFNLLKTVGNLSLHKHKSKHHYLIQISPVIERMILENAASVGIDVKNFGLPADLEQFIKESKTETSKKDPRFKSLFKAMKAANAIDIKQLETWVTYLKSKTYAADENELKQM